MIHLVPAPGLGWGNRTLRVPCRKEVDGACQADAGPQGRHCKLNKNVAHIGDIALGQTLRGLGRVFVLLLPRHFLI